MNQRYGAHEFLETQELIRKVSADIEFHALCSQMTQDTEIKSILQRHIQGMERTYHQAIQMLQHKGVQMNGSIPQMHTHHQPNIGLNNPVMPQPNPNTNRLSDMTICTLILNSHKAGSMFGMLWANECADIQLRQLHVQSANNCQQMAQEIWQYMNYKGYYQVPQLADHTMRTMNQGITANQMMPAYQV